MIFTGSNISVYGGAVGELASCTHERLKGPHCWTGVVKLGENAADIEIGLKNNKDAATHFLIVDRGRFIG